MNFSKILMIMALIFLGGCATTPTTIPWLGVQWKRSYEVTTSGARTYYYGGDYYTITITKDLFTIDYYTNEKLVLKQEFPVVSVDETKTIVAYDKSTVSDIKIAVAKCAVTTNKMEITNYTTYITNKSTSATSTTNEMEGLSAIGFGLK
ncbi:hypothetical protein [Thermospira aquatica]|uniref:Lipoprotein n=1 Tax=Thermospira aquatica TaxID=2828656 RepID=A0AAX3BDS0_9SPIR|nr:hypothetical protein [Thermospira aquatica]URA10452.1 hypothetical protein KDW03_01220 [Thermospira aquatica]